MHSAIIKRAPRDATLVTITTAIQSSTSGDIAALDVVRQAELAARRIREDAARQAARIQEEARRAGRAEGLGEFEDAVARLHRLLGEVAAAGRRIAEASSQTALDLAIEIAARILDREISAHPELLAQMVQDAVARLAATAEVTVRVHPDDLALLDPYREQLESAGGGRVRLVGDERVEGGCLVESSTGVVDAQFSTQLRALRNAMREAVHGAPVHD